MKLKLLLASAFIASTAMGAVESEMKVIGRFDYVNSQTETTTGGTKTETSSGEMQTSYLRMKNTAKFNDTITGELTLDFTDSSSTPAATNEPLSGFVDTAFITKSFGPGFTATVGKQAILVGGRENDWSTSDLYLESAFQGAIADNQIGLTLGYTVAEQTLYVQYLEGTTATLTDKKTMGVTWYGNLMNNMLNPIVSYHKEGTDEVGRYNTTLAAGLQFNMGMILVEADYGMRTEENNGTSTTGADADAELTSMVAHVRYNHENFRPFVKFMKEDGEGTYNLGGSSVEQERTAYEAGLEYVPNKDEAMRYHVVYNMAETKNSNGAARKVEDNKIFAGVKFALSL